MSSAKGALKGLGNLMIRFVFLIDCIGSTVEDRQENCEPGGYYRERHKLRQWQGREEEEVVLTDVG